MTRSYKQLDILERQRIYFLRKQGFSLRKIAEDLSRSPSTILREIKRNSGGRGYRFAQAQRKARQRGTAASSVPRKMTERMCVHRGEQAWPAMESRSDIGTAQA